MCVFSELTEIVLSATIFSNCWRGRVSFGKCPSKPGNKLKAETKDCAKGEGREAGSVEEKCLASSWPEEGIAPSACLCGKVKSQASLCFQV